MNKDQEILAISRLVFELTKISDADLDKMLARLHDLLQTLPSILVKPYSLILLANTSSDLIQVAQYGLQPSWHQKTMLHKPEVAGIHHKKAFISTLAAHDPPLLLDSIDADTPCFVLPLEEEGRPFGEVIIFIDTLWQPDTVEIEFMTDLANALSVLISRCAINETLRVREVELEHARTDAIRRLGTASEYRDNETGMHVMRMTHFATAIAKAMGLPAETRELLAICAPMHDVGKIGIPDAILLKPGVLSGEEFDVMKTHTDIGKRLLMGDDQMIVTARQIANHHHEHWDGNGYPDGLAGEDIPLLARICSVSDVFDALTSLRPYKRPWPVEEAIDWLRNNAGSKFDPAVIAGFNQALPEILRIRELYKDDIIDPNQILDFPEVSYHATDWVRWDDNLSVGIDVIDEHHRYLFDLTNDLFVVVSERRGARDVARVLKALDLYVQVHFRAEERMMAHYGYHSLDRQQIQHGQFETRLRGFYEELHTKPLTAQFDVLIYLRSWLIHHIREEDIQLRELVSETNKNG